MSIFVQSS
jgi:hypothetical protein